MEETPRWDPPNELLRDAFCCSPSSSVEFLAVNISGNEEPITPQLPIQVIPATGCMTEVSTIAETSSPTQCAMGLPPNSPETRPSRRTVSVLSAEGNSQASKPSSLADEEESTSLLASLQALSKRKVYASPKSIASDETTTPGGACDDSWDEEEVEAASSRNFSDPAAVVSATVSRPRGLDEGESTKGGHQSGSVVQVGYGDSAEQQHDAVSTGGFKARVLAGLALRFSSLRLVAFDLFRGALILISGLSLHFLNERLGTFPDVQDAAKVESLNTVYRTETELFGFSPTDAISGRTSQLSDALACLPYLGHYLIPLGFPLYLFAVNRVRDIPRAFWLIGTIQLMNSVVWSAFPSAPPWALYPIAETVGVPHASWPSIRQKLVEYMEANPSFDLSSIFVNREGAAFARLDQRMGRPFFHVLFATNHVPFAAFPSGHVAWATAVFLIGCVGGKYFGIYVLWLWWATLYSQHHNLVDGLFGLVMAVCAHNLLRLTSHGYRTSFARRTGDSPVYCSPFGRCLQWFRDSEDGATQAAPASRFALPLSARDVSAVAGGGGQQFHKRQQNRGPSPVEGAETKRAL